MIRLTMRETGSKSLAGIRSAYDALEDNNLEDGTRESAKPKSDKYPDMIKTEYEVTIFPYGRGLHSPFDTSSDNNDLLVVEGCKETATVSSSRVRDWTGMHSDDDKTQQKPALPIQSEVQDDSPKVTGTVTIIKREKGHDQDYLVKAYFNGKEASVMFDTCSPVSTIHYDDPTQSRIIKIGKKRTCN